MRTRIFFNHQTGERTELPEDQAAERQAAQDSSGPFVLRDINAIYKDGGIVSPIDGSFITSRSQMRRHNATHGVRQAGDFKPGELIAKEKARVEASRQRANGGSVEWK